MAQTLGIQMQFSCPYTSVQNGRAERKHRHIVEMGLTLLAQAHLPYTYWADAFIMAVYLINRLPTPILEMKTPMELLYSKEPEYKSLQPFGCACYPCLKPYNNHKFEFHSQKFVFLGPAPQHRGYKCLSSTGRIYISRHVVFDPSLFPCSNGFLNRHSSSSDSHECIVPMFLNLRKESRNITDGEPVGEDDDPTATANSGTNDSPPRGIQTCASSREFLNSPSRVTLSSTCELPSNPNEVSSPNEISSPNVFSSSSQQALSETSEPNEVGLDRAIAEPSRGNARGNDHGMVTRAKEGVFKPKHPFVGSILFDPNTLDQSSKPTSVSNALKTQHWRDAMNDEFRALMRNKTWVLVPHTSSQKLIDCKWVYKTKFKQDGSILKHKAQLVAKGFQQAPGLDYGETFSPVVKPTTIRVVLSLVVSFGWEIRQLDVNNAFLNGYLQEDVSMKQPEGFENPDKPNHVCKLVKALYGLK